MGSALNMSYEYRPQLLGHPALLNFNARNRFLRKESQSTNQGSLDSDVSETSSTVEVKNLPQTSTVPSATTIGTNGLQLATATAMVPATRQQVPKHRATELTDKNLYTQQLRPPAVNSFSTPFLDNYNQMWEPSSRPYLDRQFGEMSAIFPGKGAPRRRLRKLPKLDKVTRCMLELVYNESRYPGELTKRRLRDRCNLDTETIQIWFS